MRTTAGRRTRRWLAVAAALVVVGGLPATASAQTADPRSGLAPGTEEASGGADFYEPKRDAAKVGVGMALLAERSKPAYTGVAAPFNYSNINSDLAFSGRFAFSGNYRGFGVYDVSDPAAPVLRTTVNCPGGQGDVSVHGDLLFVSVEQTSARVDCSTSAAQPVFRGVRIFDISDPLNPVHLGGVQTCRGSHTHTLVTKPGVTDKLWIYNSGTSGIRPASQLAGCSAGTETTDRTTANFRIDVIEVPLAAPQTAKVVSNPRLFSICGSSACEGDYASTYPHPDPRYGTRGALNWLSPAGPQPTYPPGSGREPGGQSVARSAACHDITAYPALGLAAGACQGDGLLLDISDPVNPQRIDNVTDYNFAYWHSATFNDAGTKVVFTDEWGGGTAARCRPTDPANWGADAIYDIVDTPQGKELRFGSYYKIPNVQTPNEVCVAHNGNLVPVPGRDVMVQAWYEGGTSVVDFTDSKNPKEIAFFDRGPYHPTVFHEGGYWSTYWYNGNVFGNEIFLGFDSWALTPTSALSSNEIAAAALARVPELNAQTQEPIVHAPSFPLVRARFDQAVRSGALAPKAAADVETFVDRAVGLADRDEKSASATLRAKAGQLTGPGQQALATALDDLAASLAPYDAPRIVDALLTGYHTDGTISNKTTANLRERLDRAIAAADVGREQSAISLLRQFIDRVGNQVKGNAADVAARGALVAAAETALLDLQADDEAETSP